MKKKVNFTCSIFIKIFFQIIVGSKKRGKKLFSLKSENNSINFLNIERSNSSNVKNSAYSSKSGNHKNTIFSGSRISVINPLSYGFSEKISNLENSDLIKETKSIRIKSEKKKGVISISPTSIKLSLSPNKSETSKRDGEENYKSGRWQPEEHQKFLEAIYKFGNEWKKVEEYVGSRSSSQARSHAQKFLVKIKRANLLDLDINLNKTSIRRLQEGCNQMNSEEYLKTITRLKNVAYEKKSSDFLNLKRKNDENDKEIIQSLSSKFKNLTKSQIKSQSTSMKNFDNENLNSNTKEDNFYMEALTGFQQNKSSNLNKSTPKKKLMVPSNIKVFKMHSNMEIKDSKHNKLTTHRLENVENITHDSINLNYDENQSKNNNSLINNNLTETKKNSKRSRINSIDNINIMWEPSYTYYNQTKNTNTNSNNICLFSSSNLLPKFDEDQNLNNFFLDPFRNDKNIQNGDFPILEKELEKFNTNPQPLNLSSHNNKDFIFNIDNLFSLDINKNIGNVNMDFDI